ncbi:MAG: hypothetical protein WBP45_05915 [Daejeonella sp.]
MIHHIIKRLVTLTLLLAITLPLYSQNARADKGFLDLCKKITKAFAAQDVKTINTYIHPKKGLYIFYSPGAQTSYLKISSLPLDCFKNETFALLVNIKKEYHTISGQIPYDVITPDKINSLKYGITKFDCDSYWSPYGAFVDTTTKVTILSEVIKFRIKDYEDHPSSYNVPRKELQARIETDKKELIKARGVEKKSRRVVFSSKDGNDFIFYMTLIGNKWYLSMIDFSNSCDA